MTKCLPQALRCMSLRKALPSEAVTACCSVQLRLVQTTEPSMQETEHGSWRCALWSRADARCKLMCFAVTKVPGGAKLAAALCIIELSTHARGTCAMHVQRSLLGLAVLAASVFSAGCRENQTCATRTARSYKWHRRHQGTSGAIADRSPEM